MTDLPEAHIELLRRMHVADRSDPRALHDFKDLMGDDLANLHDRWLDEAYEDLQALGYLHRASGETFGGPFGRLSSRGRQFVEALPHTPRSDVTVVVESRPRPSDDQYFLFVGGTVVVRIPSDESEEWLLTWLPDAQDDPTYPGFTLTATEAGFPTVLGAGGVLQWAARQPWARRAAGEEAPALAPVDAARLEIPAAEYAAFSREVRADSGFRLAFSREPDGSFSWAVLAEDGLTLQSGIADSWDDARLAMIEHLYPPSAEPTQD